jgi:myo-inositol-1(or 4)-monophosphatase
MTTADAATEWAEFAEQISTAAGELILGHRSSGRVVETVKEAGELVTSADLASDRLIREAIRERYPQHQILSEEDPDGPRQADGPLWVVDPLDGTVNYARGLPHFAVSVAVSVGGIVRAGSVRAPVAGDSYTAALGKGARRNGRPLRASRCGTLSEALVSTGFPHDKRYLAPAQRRICRLAEACRDVLRLSAPALDISYVAAGQLDAHAESLAPWDIAAAGLIAREAGAVTGHVGTVPADTSPELYGIEVVVAAPGIHAALTDLLRSLDESPPVAPG